MLLRNATIAQPSNIVVVLLTLKFCNSNFGNTIEANEKSQGKLVAHLGQSCQKKTWHRRDKITFNGI